MTNIVANTASSMLGFKELQISSIHILLRAKNHGKKLSNFFTISYRRKSESSEETAMIEIFSKTPFAATANFELVIAHGYHQTDGVSAARQPSFFAIVDR